MESIKQYVISVTAAAIVCGVLNTMLKKGGMHALVKLLCGFILAFTFLNPIGKLELMSLPDNSKPEYPSGSDMAQEGELYARNSIAEIIKEQTRAYILDKANELGATLDVEVTLDADDSLTPCAVRLSGNISPYGKRVLSKMIEDDLGISTEEQIWTGQ